MDHTLALLNNWQNLLPTFALVLARITGLVVFVPFFSSMAVPARAKVLLAAMISVIILPAVAGSIVMPQGPGEFVICLAGEMIIGMMVGLMAAVLFTGLELAGLVSGQQMGIALARVFDPSFQQEASVLGQLYLWLGMIVFLLLNGHHMLLAALMDSYHSIPVGQFSFSQQAMGVMVGAVHQGFVLALKISAPVIVTLFLVTLAIGFISRTVPQINILSVGFVLRSILGFIIVAAGIAAAVEVFIWMFDQINDHLQAILGT